MTVGKCLGNSVPSLSWNFATFFTRTTTAKIPPRREQHRVRPAATTTTSTSTTTTTATDYWTTTRRNFPLARVRTTREDGHKLEEDDDKEALVYEQIAVIAMAQAATPVS